MRTTVFSTPLLTPLLRLVALGLLRLIGWRAVGNTIPNARFVLIGAPHTSNWDFSIMLLVILKLRMQVFWMGKHSLFRFPFGSLMRWLGGIPIDRSRPGKVVDQTVEQYRTQRNLVVLIPPEGTRKKVKRWKTGFYHIAVNAKVPIMLGYLDAAKKEAGIAEMFYPSGDIEKDMAAIHAFYRKKTGICPENA